MFVGACAGGSPDAGSTCDILDRASVKLEHSLEILNDTTLSPRNLENEEIRFVKSRDWTSGFYRECSG